jgi:hypothetical protein
MSLYLRASTFSTFESTGFTYNMVLEGCANDIKYICIPIYGALHTLTDGLNVNPSLQFRCGCEENYENYHFVVPLLVLSLAFDSEVNIKSDIKTLYL